MKTDSDVDKSGAVKRPEGARSRGCSQDSEPERPASASSSCETPPGSTDSTPRLEPPPFLPPALAPLVTLGVGASGRVVLCSTAESDEPPAGRAPKSQPPTPSHVAVKVIPKAIITSVHGANALAREVHTLRHCPHPYLVRHLASWQTSSAVFIQTEFLSGGDFFSFLADQGPQPLSAVRHYGAQLALALSHLHKLRLLHRDLKPENVLLDGEGFLRVADLGHCASMDCELEGLRAAGTLQYMAPEVLQGKEYTVASEMWALGCLLFEMATGLPPFYQHDRQTAADLYHQIMYAGPAPLSAHDDPLCGPFAQLLNVLLKRSPERRAGDMDELFQQPFFDGVDWEGLLARSGEATNSHEEAHVTRAFAEEFTAVEATLECRPVPAHRAPQMEEWERSVWGEIPFS